MLLKTSDFQFDDFMGAKMKKKNRRIGIQKILQMFLIKIQ